MRQNPEDFGSPGAAGALNALVRQIITNIHTAHYGSDMLPFLDRLPEIKDTCASWTVGINETLGGDYADDENDLDLDLDPVAPVEIPVTPDPSQHDEHAPTPTPGNHRNTATVGKSSRSRTTSNFLDSVSGKYRDKHSAGPVRLTGPDAPRDAKASLKELQRVSKIVLNMETAALAEEITRMQLPTLLQIQPRDWLRHGLGKRPENGEPDPFHEISKFFNYLSIWLVVPFVRCIRLG